MAEEVAERQKVPRSERPKRTYGHDETVPTIGRFGSPIRVQKLGDKWDTGGKWEAHSAGLNAEEIRFTRFGVKLVERLPQSVFTSTVHDVSPVLTPSVVGELSKTASTMDSSYLKHALGHFAATAAGLRAWLEQSAWASTRPVLNAPPPALVNSLRVEGTIRSRDHGPIDYSAETADEAAFLEHLVRLCNMGETDRALDQIFNWTDRQFSANAWQRCDAMLTQIQPEILDEDIIVGVLTATWPGRARLANRAAFVESARAKLTAEIGVSETEVLISELA